MSKIQPALCCGNGIRSDLYLVASEQSRVVDVFLGVALLERVRCSEEVLQDKMLGGRLVNADWHLSTRGRSARGWGQHTLSGIESCHDKPDRVRERHSTDQPPGVVPAVSVRFG